MTRIFKRYHGPAISKLPAYGVSLAIISAALIVPAIAEAYRMIFSNQNQITIIDPSTIQVAAPDHFKVWLVSFRAPGHFLLNSVAIMKTQHEIDCLNRQQRTISSALYGPEYTVKDSADTPNSSWSPWIPDTVSEAAGKFVCGGDQFRTSYSSLGSMSLKDISKSLYNGPWPVH